jgi:hypothetical protein
MAKANHKVYYRVTNQGSYVEVMLFVIQEFNGEEETLVARQEGMFDTMEDASTLIEYLESIGAEIEYVTIGTYTGV